MKKTLAHVAIALTLSFNCYAEDIQGEAVDSLATAQKFVTDGNYNKAIEEINYALGACRRKTQPSC